MKEYYNFHSFEIKTDKLYLPGTFVFYYHEQRKDESRKGIEESYLFDGFSINFLTFDFCVGVKIYETAI
ncbi:hypothetical protein LCGC14_2210830 [marine sediment metagenome]|uniref:Uncharacterized protein n=1 Tax=marine sediment metagenome TaxID=412755 RepID=A0A0F9DDT7_9ZZZZ